FLAVGLGAVGIARGYSIGTALHMGPGYFPVVLGILLVVVGAVSIAKGLVVTTETSGRVVLRPLLTICAAVLVFAVGIDRIGLIPSVFVSAFLASMAVPQPKILEAGLIAAVLSVLSAGIFIYGLKLPLALF
ncbi:MAG TPA: tripartite tricarboxylate transporter TctB family protein, partial [Rhodopila sp.]